LTSRSAISICTGLLLLFAGISWFAAQTKSPTYDEPYHAISSWVQLRHLDFRIDNEDPPLWQYWASLPNGQSALTADFDSPNWKDMPGSLVHQWYWAVQALYRTPGNHPVKLIAHCRAMMLMTAVLLGALICYWSWQISGPLAAIVATFLFCLDPNFLAHSSLMKNDVVFAMSMFALALSLWKAGKKLDGEAIGWVALLSVVTLTVKFSGLVAVMLVPLLMLVRAMLPQAWPVMGRVISNRFQRLLIAAGITLLAALISYAGIWAVYGFRFRPTPDKDIRLDLAPIIDQLRTHEMVAAYHGSPPPGAKPSDQLPLVANVMLYANDHELLPQAFISGFLFTYSEALVRFAYCCGEISAVGWWWYFPFAILVKTPISTLLAAAAAVILALRGLRKFKDPDVLWTAFCLKVPVILFLASAMLSNLNIGIRHVLAIYPFIFVAIGCCIAPILRSSKKKLRYAVFAVGGLLAIESLTAFPNFIPFFNSASTTLAGSKLELLGDSNLDWGQDLPLLAKWQHENPKETLYLSYFGFADPAYYGIKYIPLPGGYHYDPSPHWPDPYTRCVIAISASNLQGFLEPPELRKSFYDKWKNRKPFAKLGDSIYLFEYDPARGNDPP
jgi:hypothetical protein